MGGIKWLDEIQIRLNSVQLAGARLSSFVTELYQVQVEILPKINYSCRAGSAGWLDNLEIRLNSAQLEPELC